MEQHRQTVRNVYITQKALGGTSQVDIAEDVDLSQAHVSRILSSDEAKAMIQTGIQAQIDMIPQANTVVKASMENKDDGKLRLDAAKVVMKNTGITPSHAQINIGKMFQDNRTQIAEIDGIKEFIAWKLSADNPANAIDVTPDAEGLEGETDSEGE